MKRFALMVLVLLAMASTAMAQGVGDISVYADDQGNSCDLTLPGFTNWYVVHKFKPGEGSTSSRFKVVPPAGAVIQAFNTTFVPVGDIKTDISVGYGTCINSTTNLGNIIVTGAAAACSYVSVLPPDIGGPVLATDCSFGEYTAGAGQGIVGNDGSCPCNIATQPSTWGKVKSLYR
jgi:hypothetical protein